MSWACPAPVQGWRFPLLSPVGVSGRDAGPSARLGAEVAAALPALPGTGVLRAGRG